jgi:adenosine deaminase
VPSLAAHPVRQLFDAGVPITLNTDDPGMFACTLASEYELAARQFGFTEMELDTIRANAWNYRFTANGTTHPPAPKP